MLDIQHTAALFFLVFGLLAFVDGFYLHLWRFRLFAYDETRREHILHSVRAALFPATVYLLLGVSAKGLWLYLGVMVAATDLVFQAWDLLEERRSRRNFGGLSTFEYSLHIWLTGLHVAALALTISARPLLDWSMAATLLAPAYSTFTATIAEFLLPGACLAALLHLVLLLPFFRRAARPLAENEGSGEAGVPPLY